VPRRNRRAGQRAGKTGLELRRRQVDALLQHGPEEAAKAAVSLVLALAASTTGVWVKKVENMVPARTW
jgi:hypothetical protein